MSSPPTERVILVDFDGTLCPFSWPKPPDPPFPGVVEALQRLRDTGFYIFIFTARAWPGWIDKRGYQYLFQQVEEVKRWLDRYKVPYDAITHEKRPALLILDDRATHVTPETDWAALVTKIIHERDSYGEH